MLTLLPPAPDPGLAFVANADAGSVFTMATAGGRSKRVWEGDVLHEVRPDGTLVVGRGDRVLFLGPDGRARRAIPLPPGADNTTAHSCLSPDGRTLAYTTADGVWVRPLAGDAKWRTVLSPAAMERRFGEMAWSDDCRIVWSPDGRRLAFSAAIGPGDGSDYEQSPTVVETDLAGRTVRRRGEGLPVAWTRTGLYVLRRQGWRVYDAYRLAPSGAATRLGRRVLGGAVSRGRIVMLTDRRSWTAPGVVRIAGTSKDTDFGIAVGL